jgi:hypothetical protein
MGVLAAEATREPGARRPSRSRRNRRRASVKTMPEVNGVQRQPLLQVQRQHEVQRGVARVEGQRGEQPESRSGRWPAVHRRDQRLRRRAPPGCRCCSAEQRQAAAAPRPRHRPGSTAASPARGPSTSGSTTATERKPRSTQHAGRGRACFGPGPGPCSLFASGGMTRGAQHQRQQADGHVDQEAAAPAEPRRGPHGSAQPPIKLPQRRRPARASSP